MVCWEALASTLSKELLDSELLAARRLLGSPSIATEADARGLKNGKLHQSLSWATQATEAEGESKTCLAVPVLVVTYLLDVWLTSQMPERLTSLPQMYSGAPQ